MIAKSPGYELTQSTKASPTTAIEPNAERCNKPSTGLLSCHGLPRKDEPDPPSSSNWGFAVAS